MQKKILFAIIILLSNTTLFSQEKNLPTQLEFPQIEYGQVPQTYEIADISISGSLSNEPFIYIGLSGLSIGDKIKVPGDEITNAIKQYWKQGIFSDVKIYAAKIENGKIWINIALKEQPRISEIKFNGIKKSDIDELSPKIGIKSGGQISPNASDRAKKIIRKYFQEKGYYLVKVNLTTTKDPQQNNEKVIVNINIDRGDKAHVNQIFVNGNQALSIKKIDISMKKTNQKVWYNFFKSKKFIYAEYLKDKDNLIEKYNEIGYRDAEIIGDSIAIAEKNNINIYLTVNEGRKYYFRNIKWIGNTIYPSEMLSSVLNIKKGDVYNYKHLKERLFEDESTAVSKLYQDKGYLFSSIDPVEALIENDSIDYEMNIYEGKQATINEVNIVGNERVYEHVVRRELRTKPGQLYSQSDIMRSLRELAQMGHFDQEKLRPDIQPDPENGTVDITYELETKGSDQVEFSAGWGATGLVGSLGLKFSNFAIQNIFKPETYRIVPQGEGQTLSINARTNGQSYSSVNLSFLEPWLGGKRPNSLSTSIFFSSQTGMSSRYTSIYNQSYLYNSYNPNSASSYYSNLDPDRYMRTLGASIGYGKRLNWPDDYFTFYGELSYQLFNLKDWYPQMFPMTEGSFNNLSMNLTVSRNSTDNPLYTRRGSSFSIGLKITPPYSSLNNLDYTNSEMSNQERYKWIEYHKWTFNAKTFTPLTSNNKTLVMMNRFTFSYLGYFNPYARSPFETFYMGGDGMSAYTSYGTDYISMRGYESGSLTPYNTSTNSRAGYLYNKLTTEIRFPLSLEQSATIYGLAFFEAGNCFNNIKNYNPFDLKRSAGVGVRIFLPMLGMMGIDWGYGFDKVFSKGIETKGGSQFHFVLGQEL